MIKINLLNVERERVKRKTAVFQVRQKLTLACSLILVATALGLGWWYWSIKNESVQLDQQISDAQRETVRLQSVIRQVRDFDAQRAQLQQRVSLIEQLRKGQTGPVHMLDQVSRSLPDSMWLIELKQAGDDVTIDGRCTSLTALSDFVSSLEASGYFQRPVEIVDSTVEPGATASAEIIHFTVRGKLKALTN